MNPDSRDLLATFNAHGVECLVVGAHALAAHGVVRATKDLVVWVRPSENNAPKVLRALAEFSAPLDTQELLQTYWPEGQDRKGNFKGFHSIRMNDQWRVVFRWAGGNAFDVQVVDSH